MIQIKRLESTPLPLPSMGSKYAAGYDLSSNHGDKLTIQPGQRKLIDTGFAWSIPVGHVGIIKPRSGLAHKHGIDVLAGVIDADYTGPVKVILQNHGDMPFEIEFGDRIAQMVVSELHVGEFVEVVEFTSEHVRGSDGFGSTGVKS